SAWATVGSVYATFSVPGIHSSRTERLNLNIEVVVAKFPMPNVSKKHITKPTRELNPVAGGSSTRRPPARAARPRPRQATRNHAVTRPSARNRSVLGSMGAEPNAVTGLPAIAALGFFLGMRHATDPDHVIAISTIVTRAR